MISKAYVAGSESQGMKVVLFIGHHKVGSTSLQTYLGLNYYRLRSAGILYPTVVQNAGKKAFSAWASQRLGIGPVPLIYREAHNALAQIMLSEDKGIQPPAWFRGLPSAGEMLRHVEDQITRDRPEVLVLAAESFSNFGGASPALIARIRQLCGDNEVRILATLRRPDAYLTSWHLQRLKFGRPIEPLRDAATEKYFETIHFDYKMMLAPWKSAFADSTFIVSNYSDVLAQGGSIEHFWDASGLERPKNLKAVSHKNPSVPIAAFEIVRRALSELNIENNQSFCSWVIAQSQNLGGPPKGDIEIYGQKTRDALLRAFEPAHAYLNDLTGQERFFPDIEKMADCRPVSDLDAARAILPRVKEHCATSRLSQPIKTFVNELEI